MPDPINVLPDPLSGGDPTLDVGRLGTESRIMRDKLDEMRRRIGRHAAGPGRDVRVVPSAIPNLGFGIIHRPTAPAAVVYTPVVRLVLQGAKELAIGNRVIRYGPACCFIVSVELPGSARVIEASPEHPYIGLGLTIDRAAVADLISGLAPKTSTLEAGFGVAPVNDALIAAWAHLLALLDTPEDAPTLAPLREREIYYRLLQGPQGALLRQFVQENSQLSRVRRSIAWINAHFDQPIRTETLAEIAGMSVPSLHRHFKAATAMSPLQYQKALRLQAARRLLSASGDASRTAFAVGYESASQFSREYARMFGAPPSRDVVRPRHSDATVSGQPQAQDFEEAAGWLP